MTTLRNNSEMYITAVESALIETKLSHKREIDRLNMTLADIESRDTKNTYDNNVISQEVDNFEKGKTVINNVSHARDILGTFVGIIKQK